MWYSCFLPLIHSSSLPLNKIKRDLYTVPLWRFHLKHIWDLWTLPFFVHYFWPLMCINFGTFLGLAVLHVLINSHHWVHTFIFYPFCLIELSSSFMSLPDVFILSGRHDAIFVVGALDETVMLRGMRYHPIDIETSVVRCHRKICEW